MGCGLTVLVKCHLFAGSQHALMVVAWNVVLAYETFRVPVSVIRMFLTVMDSGLFRTSFPRSSVSCDSEDSP
jgi:hypothetical protein